ncbi:hypothetical protein [Fusobacterium sp.]|uniref:hypothetical protein n=1 Tax=Fusobacterium sp. TaxID=68766 RepID=UPI00396C86C9
MKNKGLILIEILISITLFFIIIFPLLTFNQKLLLTNRKITLMEKEYKNYQSLRKQLVGQGYEKLRSHIGEYTWNRENCIDDSFLSRIVFPYEIDRNTEFSVEITPVNIVSKDKKYRYIGIKLRYKTDVKNFTSRFLTYGFEEYK